jgi:anti-anti-sigma factor
MLKVLTRKFGNVAVVYIQGRIVVGDGLKTLRKTVVSQSDARRIILDLARVSTIDAGGLGVMLDLFQQSEANGIDFKLMNATYLVNRLLEITRLDLVFETIEETEILLLRHGEPVKSNLCF